MGAGFGRGEGLALLQPNNFTLGLDATLNTEIHKKIGSRKRLPIQSMPQSENIKNEIIHYDKQRRVLMANSVVCQSKRKPTVEPRRVKP